MVQDQHFHSHLMAKTCISRQHNLCLFYLLNNFFLSLITCTFYSGWNLQVQQGMNSMNYPDSVHDRGHRNSTRCILCRGSTLYPYDWASFEGIPRQDHHHATHFYHVSCKVLLYFEREGLNLITFSYDVKYPLSGLYQAFSSMDQVSPQVGGSIDGSGHTRHSTYSMGNINRKPNK